MEKTLTRDELLISLLKKAYNPFTTIEQKNDIKRILMDSTTMQGKNHLFLVKCFFDEETPLFHITEQEAFRQAELALKENNRNACYYLYLLYKEKNPSKARNNLRMSCEWQNPYAFLEMAKLLKQGLLFSKNREKAYHYFDIAAKCGLYEGYFGMLLMAGEDGNIQKQKGIYRRAILRGFVLPGVVE